MTYTIQAEYEYAALMTKEHLTFLFHTEQNFASRSFPGALKQEFKKSYDDFYQHAKMSNAVISVFERGIAEPVRQFTFAN